MGRHAIARRRQRAPRIRAVLAGALTLGIGASATLAAWTDTERTQGSFSTSVFDTESSADNVTYADNSSTPLIMTFPVAGMSPNTTRYAPIFVRTKAGSTTGTLALGGGTYTPPGTDEATVLGAALRYRAVSTTGTCAAAAFSGSPTWIVGPTAATLSTPGSATIPLGAAGATLPGAPSGICFEVSLPSGAASTLQGKTTTVQWQLTATSS